MCMCALLSICVLTAVHVYEYMCVRMCMHACMRVHIYMYMCVCNVGYNIDGVRGATSLCVSASTPRDHATASA
eukprot:m.464003 g.464003  ORF g.464003 m.464003 type:complete len:73 (+) comp21613_c0_seq11:315-533(+)